MDQPFPTKQSALLAVGFTERDGVLVAPVGTAATLAPVRDFYRIEIALPTGEVVSCVTHAVRLKITRQEEKP